MFGLFTTLNTFVSIIYPIIASYKAFENHYKTVKEIESGQINIAGFNVPINSLLKKAKGEPGESIGQEGQLLQKHLISTQKWLIYWIVYASCSIIEKVLFLSYIIPFYSMLRLGLSVWLLSPMFLSSSTAEGQSFDHNKDWDTFTKNGAGLLYFNYLKPWLEGELSFLSKVPVDFEVIKKYSLQYLSPSMTLNLLSFGQKQISKDDFSNPASIFTSIKSYVFSGNSTAAERKEIERTLSETDLTEEEYDVIDSPVNNSETAKKRNIPDTSEKKSSWLW